MIKTGPAPMDRNNPSMDCANLSVWWATRRPHVDHGHWVLHAHAGPRAHFGGCGLCARMFACWAMCPFGLCVPGLRAHGQGLACCCRVYFLLDLVWSLFTWVSLR